MVDTQVAPGAEPGKMRLSHKPPRLTDEMRTRVIAALRDGCDCGSETATLRRRRNHGQAVAVNVHLQCDGCGRSMVALRRNEILGWQGLDEWDATIADRYDAAQREKWEAERTIREALWAFRAPDRQGEYQEWLSSDAWQNLRAKVLKRSGGVCEACMEAPATQVHHVTYEHGWDAPAFALVAVCASCHERLTKGWDLRKRRAELEAAE